MEKGSKERYLRKIPAVDKVLSWSKIKVLLSNYPRPIVLKSIKEILDEERKAALSLSSFPESEPDFNLLEKKIGKKVLQLGEYSLKRVVNATGVILHTNLGRSPLPEEAIKRLEIAGGSYSNLEFDLNKGIRGSRYSHVESLSYFRC